MSAVIIVIVNNHYKSPFPQGIVLGISAALKGILSFPNGQ